MSNDGVKETHGDDYEKDYFTDVIKREAVQFNKNTTQADDDDDTPFFMYVATPAPHRPATPAPQYEHTFDNHPALRTPSYNYNSTDKHWLISKGIILLELLVDCSIRMFLCVCVWLLLTCRDSTNEWHY